MTRFYTNVNFLIYLLVGLFTALAVSLANSGLGAIVIPLGGGLATGLLTVGLTLARKSRPSTSLFTPINLNAILTFMAVSAIVGVSVANGLQPFLAEVAETAGQQLVLTFASSIIGGALAMVSTFAARDVDMEEDGNPTPDEG